MSNKRITIATDRYPWIAEEVFYLQLYKIPQGLIKKNTKYCVLDIGANRCYTALYFADKKWCKRIDSFEILPETFELAIKNISLNKKVLQDKIHLYNLGLGAEDKEINTFYIPYRDGISTTNEEWLKSYTPDGFPNAKQTLCKVVKSSIFLKDLIEQNNISNIIFKIDVEGAEYEIMQDLATNYPEIFEKIEIMIGDTHCGLDRFLRIVAPFNFKIVEAIPEKNQCCSFLMIKNK